MMEPASKMDLSSISPLFTESILRDAVKQVYHKKTGKDDAPGIKSYIVNYASSKGDGYLGIIYRITVQLETNNDLSHVCIIGKGMPENLTRRKAFHCTTFFSKEVHFYTKIVPAFREFEKRQRKTFTESFLAVPDCYYAMSDGENDFLLIEDLQDDGFIMLDRTKSLTPAQIQAMFKMLARFHAFSLAIKNRDWDLYEELSSSIIEAILRDDLRSWIEKYIIAISQIFCKAAEDDLNNTEYLEKLKKFIDPVKLFDNMKSLIENRSEQYSAFVISHGDAWIANFMFNKNSMVKALDFQLVRVCSPIHDVSTVIFACTTAQERADVGGVQGILDIYHDEVLDTVKALGGSRHATIGVTPYTLRKLWQDRGAFGLAAAMELVTLSVAELDDIVDANQLPEGIELMVEKVVDGLQIKGDEHKKRICDLIKLAVDDGLLK